MPKLLNENKQFSEHVRTDALVVKLVRFYSVMGNRPDDPGALALMAEILCQSATDEQIGHAMLRCTHECRYPVRLPDLLQRIPGLEVPALEAEEHKAWDIVISFADKWVQSDPEGNYVPTRGVRSSEPPKLSDRITDTVRRTGGWRIYKTMNEDDYPHQQKRFFQEYEAWTAVEKVELPKLIREMPRRHLVAKPMDPPRRMDPDNAQTEPRTFEGKPILEPMTEAQFRDRREILRQQAASCTAKDRGQEHGA